MLHFRLNLAVFAAQLTIVMKVLWHTEVKNIYVTLQKVNSLGVSLVLPHLLLS